MAGVSDPYLTLGLTPAASDAELRAAYRHLAQLHHPDHNGGSAESERRFEEVQQAYGQIRTLRAAAPAAPRSAADPGVSSRLAEMERELAAARAAREGARQAAREAAREATDDGAREAAREAAGDRPRGERPSDEELGYFKTDDSFSKILADTASGLSEQLSQAREHGVPKRLSDLIDELGSKLTGEPPER